MKEILDSLEKFEKENDATIMLAVESGSRGWGFASADSDYDIRFVFKRKIDKYLELKKPEDFYSWMDGDKDYVGFDIYKAYELLLRSNMNVIDWLLFQETIYMDKMKDKNGLRKIVLKLFDRQKYIAHNYSLCKTNYHKYFVKPAENEPTIKRYIYCIRALLSAQYCTENDTIAPINFYDLIEKTLNKTDQQEIREILEMKKTTVEKQWYKNQKWEQFIAERLEKGFPKTQAIDDNDEYYTELNKHLLNEIR